MRPSDKQVFLAAAAKFQVWILVRRTNRDSLKYIGQPGYTPKPIDCKAKTADVDIPPFKLAGLVVNPEIHPKAFKPGKEPQALAAWKSMGSLAGSRFKTDTNPSSKHYGCLLLNGKYIHGDYDLKDIIDITQAHRNLAAVETLEGMPHRRGAKFYAVQEFINQRIGSPMIQHGGEAQYAGHTGEPIDAFGPNGEDLILLNELTVRSWYAERFGGRPTLGH